MITTDKLVNLGDSEKSISCDNKGLSTTDSLLPPSEPPDIKNWFSSYEYDSLVLETNDNFGFSDDQGYENECTTENTVKAVKSSSELTTSEEKDDMIKKKTSSVLIKCTQSEEENKCHNQVSDSPESPLLSPVESEPPGIENWFSSYAYESPAPDTMDDLILSDHKENMVVCNEKERNEVAKKDENLPCVPSDDLVCSQTLEECDNGSIKDKKNSTENVNSSENAHQISSKQSKTNSLEAKCDENGFVSIKSKSKREKIDKSTCGDQTRAHSFVGKMKKGGDESMIRKTLGDVTNIDESSGKWKCPRKRKPDIGPPLKQLRLGQWFHYA